MSLTLLTTFAPGCGGRPRPAPEQPNQGRLPVALVIEMEIKGKVLGKSISAPIGVAVDRRGTLFLVDSGNNRVIWFGADLVPLRDMGGQGHSRNGFDEPRSVTVDRDLNIWVTDTGNRRVCQYNDRLEFIHAIDLHDEDDPLRFGHPGGIAVAGFGEIYVTDLDNNRVAVLDNFEAIDRFVGDFGHPGGHLEGPAGIAVDRDDHLYVCDVGNQRVIVYDDDGGVIREITHAMLVEPSAVAFDRQGWVWVLDRRTAQVHCFTASGEYLTSVGPMILGAVDALNRPSGLAFTAAGHLAITDTGHERLLICRIMYEEAPPEN